jgi:hypothetical protein
MLRDLLVLRDPKERWERCSLAPLRGLAGVTFVTWREGLELDVSDRLLLDPDAPLVTAADLESVRGAAGDAAGGAESARSVVRGPVRLFLIDSSWRRLAVLRRAVVGAPLARRLPPLATAYPRRSESFPDPAAGLASVEALFAVSCLAGAPDHALLAGYHFRSTFLERNPQLVEPNDAAHPACPDRR